MKQEIYADEIVTPSPRGRLIRYRPGRLVFNKTGVLAVEKLSAKKLSFNSRSVKRYRCVIPGLIDPHTHLVYAGHRADEWALRLKGLSYQEIAKKGGGIKKSVRQARASDAHELKELAKKRLREALSFGVCSLEIKSGYGLDLSTEIKILRIIEELKQEEPVQIFSTFLGAHAIPPEFQSAPQYVNWIIDQVLPRIVGLADFQDVFVEKNYFGVRESIKLLEAGKRYGLKPKVHAHEFGRTGGVEVACRVKAVSADHLQYVNQQDLERMKKAGVVPVVLPGTSLFLGGKKFAPARKMWDAGLPVAIATDHNPGTNPSLNLALMGSLAAIFEGLSLDEVLTAQTRNAALALGLKDRGLLQKNYRADFVCLSVQAFEEIYYHYGQSFVEAVYIGGTKVF